MVKKIKLGDEVEDKITGFNGTAVTKVEFLNGCIQFKVQPKGLKDGEMIDGEFIDVQQLKLVQIIKEQKIKETEPPGGGYRDYPKKLMEK